MQTDSVAERPDLAQQDAWIASVTGVTVDRPVRRAAASAELAKRMAEIDAAMTGLTDAVGAIATPENRKVLDAVTGQLSRRRAALAAAREPADVTKQLAAAPALLQDIAKSTAAAQRAVAGPGPTAAPPAAAPPAAAPPAAAPPAAAPPAAAEPASAPPTSAATPTLPAATEPVDNHDGRMFSSPAATADGGAAPAITEDYIRRYLFHYDFLPAPDGSDASAGKCLFSDGTASIADVIKWLEKQATADGYTPDAKLELQVANTVYEERQHAQGLGAKTAEKLEAGGDIRFLLTGIVKSNMQDMIDALEALRGKQKLDDIKAFILTGPNSDFKTPKMMAAILTAQRDLGDDWKQAIAQLGEDDAKVIRQHVLAEMDKNDFNPPAPPPPSAETHGAKKNEDDPDYTIEVDPAQGKADTQVQYTVKLKATNDDDPPKVQLLPDVEITLHVGANGAVSIENQLNLVKADIGRLLKIGGKIKIEAKVGLSGEVDIQDAAIGKIAQSLEVKIKSEIEVTITKNVSVKIGVEEGPDGKPQGGPGIVWHFN